MKILLDVRGEEFVSEVLDSDLCLLGPSSPLPQVCFITEWPPAVTGELPAPHSAVSLGGL